jgi:hypothetical protein
MPKQTKQKYPLKYTSSEITPTQRQIIKYELKEKILSVCENQNYYVERMINDLLEKSKENASIICGYTITEQNETNLKESTKVGKIKVLADMVSK